MAADHRGSVERGLRLKKAGNRIVESIGGRAIHPVNVRVGGFYRVPTRRELSALVEPLQRARDEALETVRWVSTFEFPDFDHDHEVVSLRHPGEYPITEGRVVSDHGLDITAAEWDEHIVEEQVEHSNALHARLRARDHYLVGPLARYNLNFDQLSDLARQAALDAGLGPVCRNPFQSIVVRAVEVLYACDEALRIIEGYEEPERPSIDVHPVAGTGHGCTEAPRGILYHRYQIDTDGVILDAKIVPPTSQNQPTIEHDLWHFVQAALALDEAELRHRCEQAIRNYDPCISCATHFLDLRVNRT